MPISAHWRTHKEEPAFFRGIAHAANNRYCRLHLRRNLEVLNVHYLRCMAIRACSSIWGGVGSLQSLDGFYWKLVEV